MVLVLFYSWNFVHLLWQSSFSWWEVCSTFLLSILRYGDFHLFFCFVLFCFVCIPSILKITSLYILQTSISNYLPQMQRSSCWAGVLEKHIRHLLLTLLLLLRDLLLWFCDILSVWGLTNLFYWTQRDSICTLLHQSFMKLQLPWEYIASGENTSHNFGISHFLFAKPDSNKV